MLSTFSVISIMMFLFALLFMISFHPFHMLMCVVLYSISMGLFLYKSFGGVWFTYVFIMLFVGGLMVVFVYMTSLVPNEWLYKYYPSGMVLLALFCVTLLDKEMSKSFSLKLNSFYGLTYYLVVCLALFLLVCLVVVIKFSFDPSFYMKSFV